MPVLMLVAAVIILAGVVVVASGRGGELAPEYPDYPPIDLGPVSAADVTMLRPPSAAWGYNMRVTDEALQTIARAVTERDVRIAALEQEVSDLRGQLGRGHPPGDGDTAGPGGHGDDAVWRRQEGTVTGGEPAEPALEAAAHGQPPHEAAGYADAAHEEAALAGAASFRGPAWTPGRPAGDAGDAGDAGPAVHNTGQATDPDLPRVPADAGDPARPAPGLDADGQPGPAVPGKQAAAEEPGELWDEAPHQTLVWSVAHQRAKVVQRTGTADPATGGPADAVQAGAGPGEAARDEAGQDAGDPDTAGPALAVPAAERATGSGDASQAAGSEHEHE